jgi:hypothetical protein
MKLDVITIEMTEQEYFDASNAMEGICRACGEYNGPCEPDARHYKCECCGAAEVFGLEELLLMGEIQLIGDEDYE